MHSPAIAALTAVDFMIEVKTSYAMAGLCCLQTKHTILSVGRLSAPSPCFPNNRPDNNRTQ